MVDTPDSEEQLTVDALALANEYIDAVRGGRWSEEIQRFNAAFVDIGRRRVALDLQKRAEAQAHLRRSCQHQSTRAKLGVFSDDSYSSWTAQVIVCDDCGEWWR